MLRARLGLAVLLMASIGAGCSENLGARSEDGGSAPPPATSLLGGALLATYMGVLPCADCPGIRYTLNLWGDGVFFLRITYLGKGEGEGSSFDDIGMWSLAAEGATLVLHGGREAPLKFAVKSADVLRQLDLEGKESESRLNYDLVHAEHVQSFEPRLALRGMYSYFADAGVLRECLTEKRIPVVQEGENRTLEAAYLKARRKPGEPLLVNLEGRIVMRTRIEGSGEQHMLVVERVINLWPGETCGPWVSTAELENTHWKLIRLGDQPILVSAGRPEIHVRLVREGRRVQGFAGCNRLVGGYELGGQDLRFVGLATTRMACPEGMEQEQAFLKALEATARWNILSKHLELYGSGGELLARFESRYME